MGLGLYEDDGDFASGDTSTGSFANFDDNDEEDVSSGGFASFDGNDFDYNESSNAVSDESQIPAKQYNFGYKTVGVIVAVILVLIALVVYIFSHMHVGGSGSTASRGSTNQAVTSSSNIELRGIPDTTKLDYTGEVLSIEGVVSSKSKFLINKQVVYCIKIDLAAAGSVEYFCNYGSYDSVDEKDVVVVEYQQVQEGYISVNSVSKKEG